MSMSASQSKRAIRARSGLSAPGAIGITQQPNGKGGFVAVTNGSVINNGGNAKFGLYPTVGVSLGFLLKLEACCNNPNATYPQRGVNIPVDPNQFLM